LLVCLFVKAITLESLEISALNFYGSKMVKSSNEYENGGTPTHCGTWVVVSDVLVTLILLCLCQSGLAY